MTLFKPRVGKVIFTQTTGGLSVIIPFIYKRNLKRVKVKVQLLKVLGLELNAKSEAFKTTRMLLSDIHM